MPEREFDLYLALLGRFLRLRSGQRAEIADELRDHLETRLEELTAAGLSRDSAIQAALEDLGDAAGLAADFTHIATRYRRRLIMRWTMGSVAALAAGLFLTAALWPTQTSFSPPRTIAQGLGGGGVPRAPAAPPLGAPAGPSTPDQTRSQVEARLAAPWPPGGVHFDDVPLVDFLQAVATELEVDILVNPRMNLPKDFQVKLVLQSSKVSARTVLELALEQCVDVQAGITVRDGLIYITDAAESYETRVYNCRDLLASNFAQHGGGGPGMMPGMPGGLTGAMGGSGMGMGGMSAPGGAGGPPAPTSSSQAGAQLIAILQATVSPESWVAAGGGAVVSEFEGLLIIKQTQPGHRELQELLEKMREAGNSGARPGSRPGFKPGYPGNAAMGGPDTSSGYRTGQTGLEPIQPGDEATQSGFGDEPPPGGSAIAPVQPRR